MKYHLRCAVLLVAASLGRAASPANGQNPLADAQHEYNSGRFSRAVDMLTDATAKSPDDARLHFLLGQCYYDLHEFPRAVTSLERSVQLAPNQSEYHDWLGKAYGRRAEESMFLGAMSWARKTHKEFETAVQLNPSNLEAQRDLIRFEMYAPGMVSGGDDKAMQHIEALEKIDLIEGKLALGEFLTVKKRGAEAEIVFDQVLKSQSNRIGVYFEVADYYRDQQKPEKMAVAISAASALDGNDPRLKYYKGIVLVMQRENLSEAESSLRSFLAMSPDRTDLPSRASAREWLGKLYENQGKFAEAAAEYRASLNLDPRDKGVEDALRRVQRR
jgi:tetratricopeptide (TPR) repeat protein